jgi:hypothetical protein
MNRYTQLLDKYPTRKAYPWQSLSRDNLYRRIYRGDFDDRQLAALRPVSQRLSLLKNLTPARCASDNVTIPDEIRHYRPELIKAYLYAMQQQSETN